MISITLNFFENLNFNSGKQSSYLSTQYKKLLICCADSFLKLAGDLTTSDPSHLSQAQSLIEQSCQYIVQGDKDELRIYLLAFRLQAALQDPVEVLTVFGKICTSPHVTGEEFQECFGVLVNRRMIREALKIGQHMLRGCDRLVVDMNQQKRFILKYLYIVDQSTTLNDQQGIEESLLIALIETLGKVVSLEFLKHCNMSEVRMMFYSIWNVAYEAKEHGLYKECQLMLK